MPAPFSQELFESLPVIGILRGFRAADIPSIVSAAIEGGLKNIEITMNTAGAVEQIRAAVALANGRLNIGAGTVIDLAALDQALEAGASFIVTPTVAERVIRKCASQATPIFAGALSPTEVARAWAMGATMVKIFPADAVGPGFIRSLKAPLPQIKLLPTGGVDLESVAAYLKAGADGFGVGTPLFDPKQIRSGNWQWVHDQCRAFAEFYQAGAALRRAGP